MYSFDEIKGNKAVINALKKNADSGKITNAYIIEGPKGCGKKLIANSFAKYIFCETKAERCECGSCRKYDSGNHADLTRITTVKDAKSIGVAQVKEEIVKDLNKTPFEYEHKVYIIENAHLMTVEAQNALLKSLEEPPPFVVFVLLPEDSGLLLQTVVSRCAVYKVSTLCADVVYGYILSKEIPKEQCEIAKNLCGGSIGVALDICENPLFFDIRRDTLNFLLKLGEYDLTQRIDNTIVLEKYKDNRDYLFNVILSWIRDVLTYKACGNADLLLNADVASEIASQSKTLRYRDLYNAMERLREFVNGVNANTSFGTALFAFAVSLNSMEKTDD